MLKVIEQLYKASGGAASFPYTEHGICTLTYQNNQPIGLVYAQPLGASSADILHICVLPEWRRRGKAKELIQALQQTHKTLHLEVETTNEPAYGLYISLGFITQRERQHYYGTNRHAYDMLWTKQ